MLYAVEAMKKTLYKVNFKIPTSFTVIASNEEEAKAILEKEWKENNLSYEIGIVEDTGVRIDTKDIISL